ncbi:MAG: branched-chain amino acid ABC transporter substrate-binding protein, partial [Firmicutes bacterium]|nr:branched-chain amino acid ABC transporter substrate-binding protein [Bacillota bacterium]
MKKSFIQASVINLSLVVLLVLGSLLSGCSGGQSSPGKESGAVKATLSTIKIGAAGPFSGQLSKIGLDSLNAIKMAVDEVNQAGGIGGRQVEVVVGDDGADPARALTVAEKFAADPALVGVIGPMNSDAVNAALPVYERNGLVVISQSATNPKLTQQGYKVMHRICPRDDDQGPAAALFIAQDLKAQRVYILDDKGIYGQGLADQVEKKLKELGMSQVQRGQVSPDDRDFAAILLRIRQANPDLLFLALPNPAQAANLVRQARSAGLKFQVMGGDGLKEKDQLIKASGGTAEGMYVTSIGPSLELIPEAKNFVKAFEGKYGAMSIFSGQSYEATRVLLDAIKKSIQAGGKVSRADVLAAVHNTRDYRGILGFPIGFTDKGDLLGGTIYVLQVKGDDFVQV